MLNPTPWTFYPFSAEVRDDDGDCICQSWDDEGGYLIAAAPDLLEAVKAVLAQLDYLRDLWGDEGVTRTLCDQLREAVAKAEGRFQ